MKNVAERYGLTTKAAVSLIKKHEKELNADDVHAKMVGGMWEVDEKGIRILDEILHFGNEAGIARQEESGMGDAARLSSLLEAKSKELAERENELAELEGEYKRLQDQFLHLKDDTSAVNEDLIRRYRSRSETLQKQVEQMNSDMESLREIKDKRISALEGILSQLQEKNKELNHSLQKKIDSDLENLSKSAQADKLMERIHALEMEKADVQRSVEQMRIEVSEANTRADDMERVLRGVSSSLSRTNEKINKSLSIKTELTAESRSVEVPAPSVQELPTSAAESMDAASLSSDASVPSESRPSMEADVHAYLPPEPSGQAQQYARQEMLRSGMREAQSEEAEIEKQKQKGFLGWLASRAASLLP